MKAYEFSAKITSEGKLVLLDSTALPRDSTARVIILIEEPDQDQIEDDQADSVEASVEAVEASLRRALHDVKQGRTKPLAQLWDDIDVE